MYMYISKKCSTEVQTQIGARTNLYRVFLVPSLSLPTGRAFQNSLDSFRNIVQNHEAANFGIPRVMLPAISISQCVGPPATEDDVSLVGLWANVARLSCNGLQHANGVLQPAVEATLMMGHRETACCAPKVPQPLVDGALVIHSQAANVLLRLDHQSGDVGKLPFLIQHVLEVGGRKLQSLLVAFLQRLHIAMKRQPSQKAFAEFHIFVIHRHREAVRSDSMDKGGSG